MKHALRSPAAAVAWLCLSAATGCGSRLSDAERLALCMETPASAVELPVRPLRLPPPCPHEPYFVVMGGSDPKLPGVGFPIRDEGTFREAFPCIGDQPAGVDFRRDRVEKIEGTGTVLPSWLAIVEGRTVVKTNRGIHCGGITPEVFATLFLVPAEAPPLALSNCSVGRCTGPPRP